MPQPTHTPRARRPAFDNNERGSLAMEAAYIAAGLLVVAAIVMTAILVSVNRNSDQLNDPPTTNVVTAD